jgi:hypothetical protein
MRRRKIWLFAGSFGLGCVIGLISANDRRVVHAEDDGGHGAKAEHGPAADAHLYLCAFHLAKSNPKLQFEAHHYCMPAGDGVHQCMIFDSKESGAKLLGIEYIITDEKYRKLPENEKKYWHPHAYEILSGQLIAPSLPKQGDDIFPGLLKTWGKTWHTWPDPSTAVPLGEPLLMWSANGDGQIDQALVDKRDKKCGVSTAEIRDRRKAMKITVPQLPPVKSVDEVGRQFTKDGEDEPVPLKN